MKIKLIMIGKTDEKYLEEGIEKYAKRLKHYISFERVIIPDVKQGPKMAVEKLKEEEGKLILSKIENSDVVVLLDDKGAEYTSTGFAGWMQKKMNTVAGNLVLVIGGAFGFSEEVYSRANEKLSLSKMTFSHQMVRLFITEQLYRAFSILRGEKYHHE
ncbi:MAG TPA: 23S rRNA (pseudouridine(1915)-N(3))-methyltransferase RlmH [Cytophagaceae bacterium]